MATRSSLVLFLSLAALAACDSTVVGGGGLGGGGAGGGAVVSSGDGGSTSDASTGDAGSGDASGPTVTSTGSGELPSDVQGVLVPRDADEVNFLLGNSPQSCEAPEKEPPCAPGARWVATMNIPRKYLTPGTYALGSAEIGISVWETFDDCSGMGGRGWDAEPAWLTIESIDATHAVITIEGAYDDVDGTWDVPLCGDVTPAAP